MSEPIVYEMGGFIASAWPKNHPHMKICWDLLNGEMFYEHNGAPHKWGIKSRTAFKREVEALFAEVFTS